MLAEFAVFCFIVMFILCVVIIIRWPKHYKLDTAMLLAMSATGIAAAILISR